MQQVPVENTDVLFTSSSRDSKQPISSYRSWNSFIRETRYHCIPLRAASHPFLTSELWARTLKLRGLIEFADAIEYFFKKIPTTLMVDDPTIQSPDDVVQVVGPVALIGGQDPDNGWVLSMVV